MSGDQFEVVKTPCVLQIWKSFVETVIILLKILQKKRFEGLKVKTKNRVHTISSIKKVLFLGLENQKLWEI